MDIYHFDAVFGIVTSEDGDGEENLDCIAQLVRDVADLLQGVAHITEQQNLNKKHPWGF